MNLYTLTISKTIFSNILVPFLFNKNFEQKILEKEILEFKPDIVYVHNTWFTASPRGI